MGKRFTDSDKWKKPFIKSLSTVHKLFFLYLLDDCNHAGIWHVEQEIASIRIGEKINLADAKKDLGKHIIEFDSGNKWFIPYFIEFQYGDLNPNVNAHKSVISILKKYKIQQFINPSRGVMDKDMDKDTLLKEEEFNIFWLLYDKKVGNKDKLLKKFSKLSKKDITDMMAYIPKYIKANPDKQYRKNPETFLNNKSWTDEIYNSDEPENHIDKYLVVPKRQK